MQKIKIMDGNYLVIIEKVEPILTQKGTDGLKILFRIIEGRYQGQKIINFLPLTQAAYFRVARFLHAVGFEVEKPLLFSPYELVGRGCYIEVFANKINKYYFPQSEE